VRALALLRQSLAAIGVGACATGGSAWMERPLESDYAPVLEEDDAQPNGSTQAPPTAPRSVRVGASETSSEAPGSLPRVDERAVQVGGRVLGTFRNTYYDFPNESDFDGAQTPLKNSHCDTIASVAKGFFEAVCV
jgi:hypothetical protein